MMDRTWIEITAEEKGLILEGIARLARDPIFDAATVTMLRGKLLETPPYPAIRVGVYGGVVQWIEGSPSPVVVYDYDGEEGDLDGVDPDGNKCHVGVFEATSG